MVQVAPPRSLASWRSAIDRHIYSIALCGLVVLLTLVCVPAAYAAAGAVCWPLREPATELVGYGESYTSADGRQLQHSGIDLEADVGDDVMACVAARVAFAGRVPSASGSRLAVTLELPDSRRLTVSPLESTSVSTGDVVEVGQGLGRLTGVGDPSCTTPHLHVSLREAGEYVDPATLLVPPQPTEAPAVSVSPLESAEDEPVSESGVSAGSGAPVVSTPMAPVSTEPDAGSLEPQLGIEIDSSPGMQGERIEQSEAYKQCRTGLPRQTSMNVLSAERVHRDLLYSVKDGSVWPARNRHRAERSAPFPTGLETPLLESAAAVSVVLLIMAGVGVRKRLSEVVSRREQRRCDGGRSVIHFLGFISCPGQAFEVPGPTVRRR